MARHAVPASWTTGMPEVGRVHASWRGAGHLRPTVAPRDQGCRGETHQERALEGLARRRGAPADHVCL